MEHRDRVGGRERVGDARVGDRVDVIAGDVGDREVDQPRRRRGAGETAALDRRDVLADGVDLDDPDARREQELVQVALLGGRDAAGGRLASAELPPVKQAITRSRSVRRVGDRQQALGGVGARAARQRMVGAEHLDPLERVPLLAPRTAIAPPSSAVAEDLLERGRDPQRRLAGADDEHAPLGVEPVRDAVDDQLVAVQLDRLRGGAGTSHAAARRRDPSRSPGLALAAVRERAVELDRARPGGRGGGWSDRRTGLAQAATAGARARRPGRRPSSPSSSAIRSSRLYFAVRSPRTGAPVLIWPAPRATARSAMIGSSVSPERSETTTV